MMRLELRDEAEGDILEAGLHYEREREGLGLRFESELNRTLERIEERPLQFPEVEGGVRRAQVRIFPYSIYFSVEDEVITVLAVLHARRHPRAWKRRR